MAKYGMSAPSKWKCNFCGKVFKKAVGPRTYEIKCPKCHETDVVMANPGAAWHQSEMVKSFTKADKGDQWDKPYWTGYGAAHGSSAHKSNALLMPNPTRKRRARKGISILTIAVIAGIGYWLWKRNKV